jgi:hypothetical protein
MGRGGGTGGTIAERRDCAGGIEGVGAAVQSALLGPDGVRENYKRLVSRLRRYFWIRLLVPALAGWARFWRTSGAGW